MLRKWLAACLTVLLCLSLWACNTGEDPQPGGDTGKTPPTEETPGGQTPGEGPEEQDPLLPNTLSFQDLFRSYRVGVPANDVQRAASGYSSYGEGFFVIYGHYNPFDESTDPSSLTAPEQILPAMKAQVVASAKTVLLYADEYDMEITATSRHTVNGWEMARSEGRFLLTCSYELAYNEAAFVAYAFMKDGAPIYCVAFENPEEEATVAIGELADRIARTYREYTEED